MELTSIKSIDISIVIPSNKPHGITKSYPYEIHGRRDTQDGVIGTRTTEGATSEQSARFKKKNKPNQYVEPKYPSGKSPTTNQERFEIFEYLKRRHGSVMTPQ